MASATHSEADKILQEINEDLLSCPVCLDQYTKPKLLPCNHSFCEQCVTALVKNTGRLICPTCGAPCQLPDGGVADLQGNFFIKSLIDTLDQRKRDGHPGLCQGCEEKSAEIKCLDCNLDFCQSCTKPHRTVPATRNHKLMTLIEYNEARSCNVQVHTKVYCSTHPENIVKFYCDTCQVPVCSDCIVVKHRIPNHNHRDLQDAGREYSDYLAEMVAKLRGRQEEAVKHKSSARENEKRVKMWYRDEEMKVMMKAKEVREMVGREEKRLIDELNTTYNRHLKIAKAELDGCELKHGSISTTCDHIEAQIQNGDASQLLSSKQETMRRIGELADSEIKAPEDPDLIRFYPTTGPKEEGMLGSFGPEVYIPKCAIENTPRKLWTGDVANMVIMTRDRQGRQATLCQGLRASMRRPDGSLQDMKITDNKDGTYGITLHGQMAGRYKVAITINNQPLPKSPLEIRFNKGLVKTIGTQGTGKGQFMYPTGIAINKHGDFVAADYGNGRIQIIGSEGDYKRSFTFPQFENEFRSKDVAISADDEYFMTDYGNKQVVVSDEYGNVLRHFSHPEMKYPRGIAISPLDGTLYVTDYDGKAGDTDTTTHCVWKFSKLGLGDHINSFGRFGKDPGEFFGPDLPSVNNQGMVFVPDLNNCRVQVFSSECSLLYLFGELGSVSGTMNIPEGVAVDAEGNVYVSEQRNRRVQKFDSEGRFISYIADSSDGVLWPVGIALTNDVPCKVAVMDRDNCCISVFAQ
ncbi:tripartite motif-containing protein 2-like [Ptychodera flava]|uniref:tripartite motif-containing protein 2-like n=1 Tax=Ptychodera flava TaxID=63121 RepID=UPI003969C04F